ncbi:GspE/PulE family protein [Mucilaginibacter sp. RS28]|uniref:GspE/PulE family protein n=1 Tax=Mucilaginibacter straminoryzae TaxID=2932774 RepID=A0A9X2BF18_9SPHI|nr:GspE/PulE family protein [Mucilaginibacter straminoryzae]MCJ8212043.1 GspE/PulE family protein [Mucilaginibacter straminoryzae]
MSSAAEIVLTADQLHWLTKDQAWHYRVLPFERRDHTLTLYCEATADRFNLQEELELLTGLGINLVPLANADIDKYLSKYYLKDQATASPQLQQQQDEDFLRQLIQEARNLKSSDIHIEIYEQKCRVRVRIDGLMVERYLLKQDEYPALVNKIKILSNLDIAEKRLPQDGRINFKSGNQQFDIRVSVLPTLHGEKVVLRLLSNDATNIDLYTLGFSEADLESYLQGIRRPTGILLISGPTGSGKTTTLYATLKLLNKETRNILTIEDPIEYTLEGINQVQLKESIGLGFATALKTFLRQDPDVIMVGEIRDTETANMAIRAALTGHLVLSTIHTNSAWGTISRLIDMGVPSFLLANTLNTSVAQRLIRLLCPECRQQEVFDNALYPRQFKPYSQVSHHYVAKGCAHCYYTGYKGRKAVYEVIPIDQDFALAIKNAEMQVDHLLAERGVLTLAENAFELFKNGQTSLDEIYPLLFNY